MSRPSSIPPVFLSEAVRAARDALRRLEDDAVPAALRKVAASSARRLPPPLLVSLLDELDDRSWLREAALDEWEEADPASTDPALAISALFLFRPEGWETRVARLVAQAAGRRTDRDLDEARREIHRLERLVDELSARLDDARADTDRERARATAAHTDTIRRLEEARNAADRRRADLEAELRSMGMRLAGRERDLDEADARIDELRRRIARRERPPLETGVRGFGRGSPVEVARDLDHLADSLRAVGGAPSPTLAREAFRLPAGLRPDEQMAIEWLLGLETPMTMVVDGYNVAHQLDAGATITGRRRLEEALIRLRRLAAAPINVVLMWDSSVAEERWAVRTLDVRYVPNADDAIVEAVRGIDGRVVVVTSDKELRDRTRGDDVVALWSEALSDWTLSGR